MISRSISYSAIAAEFYCGLSAIRGDIVASARRQSASVAPRKLGQAHGASRYACAAIQAQVTYVAI